MKKIEKAKQFVKEHKKGIAVGVITAVTGGVLFAITKKRPKIGSISELTLPTINDLTKLDIPESLAEIGVWDISSSRPDKWFDIWLNNTPLSELGKLGEELQNAYGWWPEQTIGGVVSTKFEIIEKVEF